MSPFPVQSSGHFVQTALRYGRNTRNARILCCGYRWSSGDTMQILKYLANFFKTLRFGGLPEKQSTQTQAALCLKCHAVFNDSYSETRTATWLLRSRMVQ